MRPQWRQLEWQSGFAFYFTKNPKADPIWKMSTARPKASAVLNAMAKTPHFQDPDSLEMQITETKQGE